LALVILTKWRFVWKLSLSKLTIEMVISMEKKSKGSLVKNELSSLVKYRNALESNDQAVFDKLLNYAKNHVAACAKSERNLLESMLLAIVLEQQKKIDKLSGSIKPGNSELETAPIRPQDSNLSVLAASVRHQLPWVVS
jgi:hypothetical protein